MAEHSPVSILGMLVRIISFLILWFGCCQPAKTIPILDEKQLSEEGAPGPSYTGSSSPPLPNDEGAPGPSYTGSSSPPLPSEGAPGPSSPRLLPDDEVSALYTVLSNLEVLPLPSITPSYCENPESYIGCTDPRTSDSNVRHISEIQLAGSRLSGNIPENISELTDLEILDLSNNEIIGIIPDSLGDLRKLTSLDLSGNQLIGPIPQSLGKLQSLTELDLSLNFLNGTIPPSVGNLSSLLTLSLWSNNLTGPIPPALGNLSKLETLRLDENQLDGPLPPELGELGNITALWLTSNKFNGTLPESYSKLTSLWTFAVAGNNLSGPIPDYFKDWNYLGRLMLLGNSFDGPLPQYIFNMTSLWDLSVSDLNSARFSIPDSANLPNLYSLILRNCSINGSIPENIGNWSGLTVIDLSFNYITGIPDSMKNLKNLEQTCLTSNMLEGKIPGWIDQTVQIKWDLSYNNFTNTDGKRDVITLAPSNSTINFEPSRPHLEQIAETFCNGSKSKYHSLFINSGGEEAIIDGNHYDSDNSTLNYYVSPERNWAYSCSGYFWEPSTADDYIKNVTCGISVSKDNQYKDARLCPTSLRYYGFCLQNGNYTVQLHFAEIVYAKVEDHSSLGKRVFDVYIQGERKLQDFNIKEKAGGPNNSCIEMFKNTSVFNNQLEIHLFWAGKGSIYNAPALNGPLISAISVTPDFKFDSGRKLSAWKIAVITVGSVFALLLLLALLWRMDLIGDRELRESKVKIRGKDYTIKQIIDATRKFSPEMEIGRERFGIMYKAELPDKVIVAVKKLSPQSKQVIDQIRSEVDVQKEYKHENLVELLDGYSKKDLHLMIYGYMEHTLFDPKSTIELSWENRCDICLGMAEGLKYLHERTPMVIHGNIKPSNILLDGDRKAKISDIPYTFIGKEETNVYMAPEHAIRTDDHTTEKVDVYSFGLVLLELISGKRSKAENLVDSACVLLKEERLQEFVDNNLPRTYNTQQAKDILALAVTCVHISPTLRPTMSEVVNKLKCNAPILYNLKIGYDVPTHA